MAADSDGSLTAVVICEGNLHDPEFPRKFRHLLTKLKYILQQPKTSKKLKVNKVEPWNSVRVTLSIPKDAAAKLRQLASEGSNALRALGILSVQLEGDTVISLRLVGHDLVLRTDNTTTGCVQEAGSSNTSLSDLSQILGSRIQQTTAGPSSCSSTQTIPHTASSSTSESVVGPPNRNIVPQSSSVVPVEVTGAMNGGASGSGGSLTNAVMVNGPTTSSFEKQPLFKSPNTVCPMDGKLPVPPLTNIAETREYPFESMTQARVIQRRENTMAVVAALGAGAQPTVAISNAPLMSQGRQITPPPLAIPVAGPPTDAVAQQPAQAVVKSSFMQPPPPPYPIASGTNTLKPASHTVQHALQQQTTNTISLSNGTNALSSPLLVNLLQNDGVNQMKVPSVASSVLLQQQQVPPSALMVSNLTSHTQNDGVLLLNNSNNSNDSGSISISPSIPVPSSSQTISNISNNAASATPVAVAAGTTGASGGILNQNVLGSSHQSVAVAGVGIRVQQQRFTIPPVVQQQQTGVQQSNLLPQHQIIQGPSGVQMARFPAQQHQILGAVGVMGGVAQPSFRLPQQQSQSQQVGMQQPFVAPSQSLHPSLVNHPQQQLAQQSASNNFNHARWPFKPMDSATKSSFQEFARYQLQYNLQQEMNSQTSSVSAIAAASTTETSNLEAINSMGNAPSSSGDKSSNVSDALGYLDELSKTDLDSLLLPGLVDLDSTLDLDGKNALESLLDGKDLVLDLIDQDGGTAALPDSIASCPVNSTNIELQPPASVVTSTTTPSPLTQQIQLPPPGQIEKVRTTPINAVLNQETCELTSSGKKRQYLINPLTGELEAMPSEDESESEEPANDNTDVFNELNSEVSNSLYSDDENSCSTAFSKTSDHSDTERSSNSEASGRSRYSKPRKERRDGSSGSSSHSSKKSKPSTKNNLLRDRFQQSLKDKMSGKSRQSKEKIMTKAKLIPIDGKDSPSEKIKLRLKLEKSEPVSTAYKVDISFVPSPKRAQSAMNAGTISLPNYSSSQSASLTAAAYSNASMNQHQQNSLQTSASHNPSNQSPHSEEPRVPPLHISLRGKNSIVIKNSKKDRKKSQSGGEEDESYLKKVQMKRNNNSFDEQNSANRYNVTNDHSQFSTNMNMKGSGQGKPITRIPANDDYPGSNNFSKPVLENGEDLEKGFLTSKRVAMETATNPNGLICPETKRRRMSQSHEQQQQINELLVGEKHVQESFNHLQNPIGSTNVGTLPAHTSLSKNQKVSNNNNSSSFINKLHKSSIKSGKPLVVVKHCKSPTTNPVKDPGKSPPTKGSLDHPLILSQTNSQAPALLKPSISSSCAPSALVTTSKSTSGSTGSGNSIGNPTTKPQPEPASGAIAQQKGANKYSNTVCPLPQGSTEAMSKEKFKQKLLEFQGTNDKEQIEKIAATNYVVNTSCSSNSNSAKAHEQIVQLSETKSGTLPITLLDRRTQNPTTQVAETAKSITVNTSVPSAVSSNTNSVDSAGLTSSENDLKEQCAMQEQQLRPPNQNQNPGSVEVGQNLLNNGEGSSNVRNSPGSQAQGEDSGIESMDALSEKSPHQSASPQQGDTQPAHIPAKTVDIVHSKIEEKISLVTNPKDDQEDEITNIRDIEAALAKMEGLNEHFLTPCESAMHKLNGEHSMKEESLLENLTDEKILLCATKLEQEDDLAAIMGGNSSGKSTPVLSPLADVKDECRDLNENKEISSKLSLETQLVDECCKKSLKPNIKHEDDTEISTRISTPYSPKEKKFEENVIETASSLNEIEVKVSENIKVESAVVKEKEETVNAGAPLHTLNSTSSPLSGDVISEANDKSLVDIKEMLTPITIEIPTHPESEVPRVRTRASSKLESPLDAPKQSPQLDSPATTNNPKSNLKLCASTIDRLSPKGSTGKSGCPGGVVSTGNKRKRQGSESSTQSCVSDDTPSRSSGLNSSLAKRSRPNSSNPTVQSSHESNPPSASSKSGNIGSATHKKQTSSKTKKTQDESSDSDEPLIEVAGKVRSCKSSAGRQSSSSEDRNDNKVLRNHRTSSQQSRTSAHSSSSSATSTAPHQTTGHSHSTSKTNRGANGLHSNSGAPAVGANAVAVSNCSSNSIANNTHCTRASGVNTLGVAASSAIINLNNNATGASSISQSSNHSAGNAQLNASHDDKIGTRRSVRASAAANKIIYSRSGGPANHSNSSAESSKTSAVGSHKNVNNAPSVDSSEPRRKTRSAAGGEATDGRRRRGSRDSK